MELGPGSGFQRIVTEPKTCNVGIFLKSDDKSHVQVRYTP